VVAITLLDSFPDHISFHPCNCSSLRDCKTHLQSLDHLCLEASSSPSTLVVVTDASVIPSRHIQTVSAAHLWNLVSYTNPPVQKQRPCGETTSEPYKPAFHGGHLSRNMSHGGAATLRIFRLPWQRYSYSTQSSMTKLLLSVSQH